VGNAACFKKDVFEAGMDDFNREEDHGEVKEAQMNPFFAACLSLVPGAGHWALGRRRKAAALFFFDFGILFTLFFLRSNVGRILASFSYLLIMIPAVLETYTLARGGVNQLSESKPYIIALLFLKGFSALPLLWQSRVFSKQMKIAGSIVVPLLAFLYWGFLGIYGLRLYHYSKIHWG